MMPLPPKEVLEGCGGDDLEKNNAALFFTTRSTSRKPPTPPRLILRNLPFNQSHNTVRVEHNQGWRIGRLVRHDLFHFLLRLPLYFSISLLLAAWSVAIVTFAGLYMAVDRQDPNLPCGLGPAGSPIQFYGAWAFALETTTTVGFGLPSSVNSFFQNCPSLQVTIYFQMVWSILYNAFMFAFFYSRIARSEARGVQVIFSDKALVSLVGDQVRFQVRVYDVDAKHPVVDAHVRVYAVKKNRPVPQLLRLIQPNDELNAWLFLSLPSVVAHHIDLYSVLHPPTPSHARLSVSPSGLTLRQADSITGFREEVICPVCGESYGTHDRWVRHVRYQQLVEEQDELPVNGAHRSIPADDLSPGAYYATSCTDLHVLQEYFDDEIAEVIVMVEGIDPLMSGTFQAIQSYCIDDIVWDNAAAFHPCIEVDDVRKLRVDLDRFHNVDYLVPDSTHPSTERGTLGKKSSSGRSRQFSIRTFDMFLRDGHHSSSSSSRGNKDGRPVSTPTIPTHHTTTNSVSADTLTNRSRSWRSTVPRIDE